MQVFLREMDCGPCPYLEDREWRVSEFSSASFSPRIYEELLAQGFRRSGHLFYRNRCQGCTHCVPIRLDASTFEPSATMLRLARLNADLRVTLVPATYDEERFKLYARYMKVRHVKEGEAEPNPDSYRAFLIDSPLDSTMISEYRLPDGKLVANGYLDVLETGLSSVYFAFDPDFSRRSLGVWSVGRELALGAAIGKPRYYLGFWVPGSPKMDYKGRYRPFEYAKDGVWIKARDREEARAALETR